MRLRLNLQRKVLLLVAGTMTVILLASAYLHGLLTQLLIEDYRYDNAVGQVVTVAKRTMFALRFGAELWACEILRHPRVNGNEGGRCPV